MLTPITILVLITLFVLVKTFVVVPMRENVVVERLGKFRAVLQPGFHFLVPFFDRIAYRHDMREQVIDVSGQSCITRDNIQVEVDGLVYLQVLDPEQAATALRTTAGRASTWPKPRCAPRSASSPSANPSLSGKSSTRPSSRRLTRLRILGASRCCATS